ncbi:Slp family lipoprotein [Candidatus Methylacidiphilum infernorum]|uniref:Slp family lipoprotein n=1 Tax=Candidatus Methylacidiphilum infernorum TaxID=511746 RepID=A0ABX7PW63_9BACT|nr:Slp family lipoprotein [Candidatus Methylacidiphilum infernorum]QSR86969.1 Slp family lipoprotein [Candidatus Methylacidiphilum infernorum]
MKKKPCKIFTLFCIFWYSLIACQAGPFTKEEKNILKTQPPFSLIIAHPEEFIGSRLFLGGVIAQVQNLPDKTLMEVIHKPLSRSFKVPLSTDLSYGRFIVSTKKFLDPSIYTRGKSVTVIGRLSRVQRGIIGQRPYKYPVISASHIHLWSDTY